MSTPPSTYRELLHPLLPFDRQCQGCTLANGLAVGGAGPDDLTQVKLIVISDHTGYYEAKAGHPFYDNEPDRAPKRNPRTARYSLLGFRNAGAMLRFKLNQLFGLDTYHDCWLTNAIKCDPEKVKPQEKHAKVCSRLWLLNELAVLDQYVPTAPILIAGNLAYKSLRTLQPELTHSLPALHDCRRTNHYRLREHPLVFTVNPAIPARSEFRLETDVSLTVHRQLVVNAVAELPLVGTPVWHFERDLEWLRPFLT